MSANSTFCSLLIMPLLAAGVGCSVPGHAILAAETGTGETGGDTSTEPGTLTDSGGETNGDGDGDDPGEGDTADLDLPDDPALVPSPACTIDPAQLDGALPCGLEPPSDVIAPVTAWTWTGHDGEDSVLVTPLVANLDDDNGDGFVDLCDDPDIVVAAVHLPPGKTDPWPVGHLHLINGASGATTRVIPTAIDASINPALADLDGDGIPEIVALQAQGPNSPYQLTQRRLMGFRADGELAFAGEHWQLSRGGGAISIADLDNDGSPEILAPEYVTNATGQLLWAPSNPATAYSMPVAVDLDLDGDLEVLFGGTAYDHDGSWRFDTPTVPQDRGSVAVANFDDDEFPELYVQHDGEHAVLEHDGTVKAVCPTGNVDISGAGGYPVAIRDLDGDGRAELVFGFQDKFYVLSIEANACVLAWSKKTDAPEGLSSGTLFDFLDDGHAEAIYADRSRVKLYSSTGELLFQINHSARESIANPVVADVDGDGAAEILIVSSAPLGAESISPSLIVLENADDRFAATRRVWNQHTYHHSNINEIGQVPSFEPPHWHAANSFRANSHAYEGDLCIPPALPAEGP
ncbi:Hemolysin-related protein RbmC [Enhygromyxa salina]|uniref:Hemolysin-related protein RbmC n=1 Tax=Enhygromyxa salina TaxID=215803 RepID=A0A0C2D0X8_9BACT|nr:VCBS repeat-containing protein [Enhygromyxa salina]KIG15500.1 Hemolysin-related protein RbmC [Enhygromyxa salina]